MADGHGTQPSTSDAGCGSARVPWSGISGVGVTLTAAEIRLAREIPRPQTVALGNGLLRAFDADSSHLVLRGAGCLVAVRSGERIEEYFRRLKGGEHLPWLNRRIQPDRQHRRAVPAHHANDVFVVHIELLRIVW